MGTRFHVWFFKKIKIWFQFLPVWGQGPINMGTRFHVWFFKKIKIWFRFQVSKSRWVSPQDRQRTQ